MNKNIASNNPLVHIEAHVEKGYLPKIRVNEVLVSSIKEEVKITDEASKTQLLQTPILTASYPSSY